MIYSVVNQRCTAHLDPTLGKPMNFKSFQPDLHWPTYYVLSRSSSMWAPSQSYENRAVSIKQLQSQWVKPHHQVQSSKDLSKGKEYRTLTNFSTSSSAVHWLRAVSVLMVRPTTVSLPEYTYPQALRSTTRSYTNHTAHKSSRRADWSTICLESPVSPSLCWIRMAIQW